MCVERPRREKEESERALRVLLNVAKSPGRTDSRVRFVMPSRDLNDAQGRDQKWRTVSKLYVQEEWYQELVMEAREIAYPVCLCGTDLPLHRAPRFLQRAQPSSLFSLFLRLLSIE